MSTKHKDTTKTDLADFVIKAITSEVKDDRLPLPASLVGCDIRVQKLDELTARVLVIPLINSMRVFTVKVSETKL